MSGDGHAAITASRAASVARSPVTTVTFTPVSVRISAAVASSVARVRAMSVSSTPSRARLNAAARPSPFEAAQTIALRPSIPSFIPRRARRRQASART